MAIVQKELKDVSTSIRSLYQKALHVLETDSGLNYGIELLKNIVQREPGFLDARKALRKAEQRHCAAMGGIAKFFAQLKCGKFLIRAKTNLNKNPLSAMVDIEEALALYLHSAPALNILAEAAKAAGGSFIAIEALELLRESAPDNEDNLNKLCELYKETGDGGSVLQISQKLASLHPDSLELQARVREAAAIATMSDSSWKDQGSSFRDKIRKTDGEKVVSGDKIIRAEEDVQAEIARIEQKIAAGGPEAESLDLHRKLAEFYIRINLFEKALNVYNWIVEKMGTLDPAIDKAIERAKVAIGRRDVETLRKENAPESEISTREQAIYNYRLERAEDRIRLYPNDLVLRYELAELYWEGKSIDKALEQFQLAQRQPQKRLSAIVYLGRCFHEKKQYDMALEQFTKALQDMLSMNSQKLDTLYYLGITYEAMGRKTEALDCFKQIYSADITYRDVKDRVSVNYSK